MMISGTVNQVLTALHLVLAKMNSERSVQETMLARSGSKLVRRMLLLTVTCRDVLTLAETFEMHGLLQLVLAVFGR